MAKLNGFPAIVTGEPPAVTVLPAMMTASPVAPGEGFGKAWISPAIMRPDGAADITVPEMVASGPLTERVLPATAISDLPSGVKVWPTRVKTPLTVDGFASGSGAGDGMAKVLVPSIKPAEARDITVPDIVPFGLFEERVLPATSILEVSSNVKVRPVVVSALSALPE